MYILDYYWQEFGNNWPITALVTVYFLFSTTFLSMSETSRSWYDFQSMSSHLLSPDDITEAEFVVSEYLSSETWAAQLLSPFAWARHVSSLSLTLRSKMLIKIYNDNVLIIMTRCWCSQWITDTLVAWAAQLMTIDHDTTCTWSLTHDCVCSCHYHHVPASFRYSLLITLSTIETSYEATQWQIKAFRSLVRWLVMFVYEESHILIYIFKVYNLFMIHSFLINWSPVNDTIFNNTSLASWSSPSFSLTKIFTNDCLLFVSRPGVVDARSFHVLFMVCCLNCGWRLLDFFSSITILSMPKTATRGNTYKNNNFYFK